MPLRGIEAEWPRIRSAKAPWGLRLGLLALATLAIATLAFRTGAFSLLELFATVAVGSLLALAGLIASIVSLRELWSRGGQGAGIAFLGLAVSGLALAPATLSGAANLALPAVNDVSTDLRTPPDLSAVAGPRAAAGARTDLPPETAARVHAGYPGLGPLLVESPPDLVFEAVRALVTEYDWAVAAANPPTTAAGLLVATATTPVMRFPDDVAIRVSPAAQGSRIDMRSASRLGRHDLGSNARRIRAFFAALDERLNEAPR